jgi:hypothetical protein
MIVETYPNPTIRICMSSEDTVIGSQFYSKLYYCGGAYKGALRDDIAEQKVFYVPADSSMEFLVYDFGVTVGETVTVYQEFAGQTPGMETLTISSIDSVLIDGSYRKRIYAGSGPYYEGIGGHQGLFHELWPNVSNYYHELECMSEDNTILYPTDGSGPCSLVSGIEEISSSSVTVAPNPSSASFIVKAGTELERIAVVDLLGRTVYETRSNGREVEVDPGQLPAGVYFLKIDCRGGLTETKKIVRN